MAITCGRNMQRMGLVQRLAGTILLKSYTTHSDISDVFISYRHADQDTALELAEYLDEKGRHVFMDIHDETLHIGDKDLDDALEAAITNAHTMLIVVSEATQESWWVPWEIGVSTPSKKPRELYRPTISEPLPSYLQKLEAIRSPEYANIWILLEKIALTTWND